jgi:glycosyltransferase involved in cell wall biosynthesis
VKNIDIIAYLSPVFSPAVGGGVVYLDLLSEQILEDGGCENFVIITESYPGMLDVETHKNGRLQILRKYPFRAGRDVKDVFSYVWYFIQNLQFLSLPFFLRKASVSVLMVHGSFINNPTTLWLVLRVIRVISPKTILVADLRDPKLPQEKIKKLKLFDLVISCSENITGRLKNDHVVYSKVHEIPIIVDVTRPSELAVRDIQKLYGLEGQQYVFNGSGLSSEKGVERLVELVTEIRRKGYDVSLVVVGKKRHWGRRLDVAEQEGWFHYLGVVTHEESLALSVGAWLDVNLSTVDSMPRHSLEALFSGSRVLLPNGVPEFERVCPDFIGHEESINDLAVKAIHIAENDFGRCEYDMTRHLPDVVIKEYVTALRSMV